MTRTDQAGTSPINTRVAIAPIIGLGRTIIALAQASVFVFSEVRSFFVPVGNETFESSCNTFLGRISLFCWLPSQQIAAAVSVLLLLLVASGFAPRYTSWVHAYVSLSFIGVLALPDGGDLIATNVSLLLVFAYAGDPRLSHWGDAGSSRSAALRGVSRGAQFAVQVQVAFIYFHSATAKFAVETWADGTQMYYVTRQEMFGSSGLIGDVIRNLTTNPLATLALSWGAIAIELAIAILVFIPRKRAARTAILLSAVLHLLIIAIIGLGSFGLIMVGVVMCAAGSRLTGWGDLIARDFWMCRFQRAKIRKQLLEEIAEVSPVGGPK